MTNPDAERIRIAAIARFNRRPPMYWLAINGQESALDFGIGKWRGWYYRKRRGWPKRSDIADEDVTFDKWQVTLQRYPRKVIMAKVKQLIARSRSAVK